MVKGSQGLPRGANRLIRPFCSPSTNRAISTVKQQQWPQQAPRQYNKDKAVFSIPLLSFPLLLVLGWSASSPCSVSKGSNTTASKAMMDVWFGFGTVGLVDIRTCSHVWELIRENCRTFWLPAAQWPTNPWGGLSMVQPFCSPSILHWCKKAAKGQPKRVAKGTRRNSTA